MNYQKKPYSNPLERTQITPLDEESSPTRRQTFTLRVILCITIAMWVGYFIFMFRDSNLPGITYAFADQATPSSHPITTDTPFLFLTPTKTQLPTATTIPTKTVTTTPTQTPSPTPQLPPQAYISNINGNFQTFPLSCEASSAVDWAAYFGYAINEANFFWGIPTSDNPEKGFVGNVYGMWGQIPPYSYGVHAKPIAKRLRGYGVPAKAVRNMTLEALKREIAAGHPVIVWVISHVYQGTPVKYTASDGQTVVVARFEHTVIVTGYDNNKFTFLDGGMVYQRYEKEFLRSWAVLGDMAIVWEE